MSPRHGEGLGPGQPSCSSALLFWGCPAPTALLRDEVLWKDRAKDGSQGSGVPPACPSLPRIPPSETYRMPKGSLAWLPQHPWLGRGWGEGLMQSLTDSASCLLFSFCPNFSCFFRAFCFWKWESEQ